LIGSGLLISLSVFCFLTYCLLAQLRQERLAKIEAARVKAAAEAEEARRVSETKAKVSVCSAGPDGQHSTNDDIIIVGNWVTVDDLGSAVKEVAKEVTEGTAKSLWQKAKERFRSSDKKED
jgi:hypothetical protein